MLKKVKDLVYKKILKKISLWDTFSKYYISTKRYIDFVILNKNLPLPSSIQVEITTKCNCKCIACSRGTLNPSRLNKDMSLDEFKKIISQIHSLKWVQLSGLGEPLFHKNLKDILVYAVSKGIYLTTNTNGTTLNEDNIDLILKYFHTIVFSFDSVYKENFERIRSGANYDSVCRNIRELVKKERNGIWH
ncbi:MAG: radical SAM protein [Candidatus Omnitrophica bacterium]|nr:radical SAM protein [Candidatus Omnitrophota bacterium]